MYALKKDLKAELPSLHELVEAGKVQELEAALNVIKDMPEKNRVALINQHDNEILKRVPLHYAASNGNELCVKLLIQADANINEQDVFGRNPLTFAAANGQCKCMILLLEAGADVNQPDDENKTALHWAAFWGYGDAAQLLIEYGANYFAKSKSCGGYEEETPEQMVDTKLKNSYQQILENGLIKRETRQAKKEIKQMDQKNIMVECSICLDTFPPHQQGTSELKCKHAFHSACIDDWIKKGGTCPLCRTLIDPTQGKKDYK